MIEALLRASLSQRLFALAVATLLTAWGAVTALHMPVDVFPDLNKPTVTLLTEAGGMAPEEVEQLVTFPIESAMNGMPGVTRVRSVSSAGLAIVFIEFDWGADLYRNRQQVAERLALVAGQLPPGVTPQMGPVSSIMGEIMLLALPIDATRASPMAAREFADWVLRPRLLTIPGVAQVIPIGGELREYLVEPDTARMADLGIALEDIERVLRAFAANTSGGFLESRGREYLIRNIGRTTGLADLEALAISSHRGQPVTLRQVASVRFGAKLKRGEAGYNGGPAVILAVQKQPAADTVKLTAEIESALGEVSASMPAGLAPPQVVFRQASFIASAVSNVAEALRDGALMVAVVLFLFLLNLRTTLISLLAIPVSLLATVLVFKLMGLTLNTMTLGGLAIAIGELVDDAVVGVENVLRRLRVASAARPGTSDEMSGHGDAQAVTGPSLTPARAVQTIREATLEVRSAIVYATFIIVLVFVPLFFLPGIEGRLFSPLGVAYIVSILASMVVSVTVTPVLAYYLLPRMKAISHGDSPLVSWLKRRDAQLLSWSFDHARLVVATAALGVAAALAALPFLPRSFLPPFNEGTLTVNVLLAPGTALAESDRIGREAERQLAMVPEVTSVARRTGRAELDEHAEGVHYSEIDVDLRESGRRREAVVGEIRTRLSTLPVSVSVGQPISHRLDHLLSGVRAQIALKIFGDDLDTLRGLANDIRDRLAGIPGIVDLGVEKAVRVPQVRIEIDYTRAAQLGVSPSVVLDTLRTLVGGETITQVIEGSRRFDLVLRLPERNRSMEGLAAMLIETPHGRVPLAQLAHIEESDGPNQVSRDDSRRRIVVSANATGRALSAVVADIRSAMAAVPLPEGYSIALEGQFQAQEQAQKLIAGLASVSLAMIFLVLYSRYRSAVLALMIMGNIPLALVGSVVAMAIAHTPLSVASMVGFVTLAGIATRNGILKISHYINLCAFEGERFGREMIVRGSLERLTPVLMTALVAAFALTPLLLASDSPGKEILHPVAVVIFGGLVSSTLLDTLLTPVMFYLWGKPPLIRLLAQAGEERTQAAY